MTRIKGDLFSPRTLFWLFSLGTACFLIAVFLLAFGNEGQQSGRAAAHPYSDSAIGHRAFVQYLRELGVPTVLSRNKAIGQEEQDSLLVLLEPPGRQFNVADRLALFSDSRPIFLVLPKWSGDADKNNPGFLERVWLKPEKRVLSALSLLNSDVQIVREDGVPNWSENALGVTPSLTRPQLMTSEDIEPVIAAGNRILFGKASLSGRTLFILSDPDILNNHGIDEGQNHILLARMMNYMRDGDNAVFIDATIHGFVQSQNLWRRIFDFPYVIVTLCAFVSLVVFIWAASPRFGGALMYRPRLQPGKAGLIENTATLLDFNDAQALIVRDYLDLVTEQVRAKLHLKHNLKQKELAARLDKIGESRGTQERYSALSASLNVQISTLNNEALAGQALAQRIHIWRLQILRPRPMAHHQQDRKVD